jgi:hypothetical protein
MVVRGKDATMLLGRVKNRGKEWLEAASGLGQVVNLLQQAKVQVFAPPSVDPWLSAAKNQHRGERCFVVATGPSLNDLDLSRLKGERVFGVNGAYMLSEVELTYFVYASSWWHKQHIEGLRNVRCTRRFLPREVKEELESEQPTTWYRKFHPRPKTRWGVPLPIPAGFSRHADRYLYTGGTVVFVCLQLAYFFGFSEVIIIGLDHSYSKEKDHQLKQHNGAVLRIDEPSSTHFSPNYIAPGTDVHIDLGAMERGYELAQAAFLGAKRRILNASSKTMLHTFPRVDYASLF